MKKQMLLVVMLLCGAGLEAKTEQQKSNVATVKKYLKYRYNALKGKYNILQAERDKDLKGERNDLQAAKVVYDNALEAWNKNHPKRAALIQEYQLAQEYHNKRWASDALVEKDGEEFGISE